LKTPSAGFRERSLRKLLRYKHSDLTSGNAAENYEKKSMLEHVSELGLGKIQ
jgi:hypothetical protein